MARAAAWLVLAAAAWCARAGPGPPPAQPLVLRFAHPLYNVTIPENSPPRTYATQPPDEEPLGVWLPAPGLHVRFRIRAGDKDRFFKAEERVVGDFCFLWIRTRAGHADVLNRERRDSYRLEIRATASRRDGAADADGPLALEADVAVALAVADVDDLGPLFYPTEYSVTVPEDAPPHSSVARVAAEDADLGLNGEIYYGLAEADAGLPFAVHPTSGVVSVTRPLAAATRSRYDLTVLARSRGSLRRGSPAAAAPPARAALAVRVLPVNLHAPELRVRRPPALVENVADLVYAIVAVVDRDEGAHGEIESLEIVDGDPDGHFRIRPSSEPGEYDVVVHELLDRERAPRGYNLTLRAVDAGVPPRQTYETLPVRLADVNDNAPVFGREIYEVSVPETAPPNTPVIRLKVTDPDEGANARVYIEIVGGNEGGEFAVNPDTGMLYTAVTLDAEEKAFYTLTVSAVDQGDAGTRKQSSAKVKINVVDANDNDPIFDANEMDVSVRENGPGGTVVARVVAKDADSGENAYISYSIANLSPVPFEVDHFSGAVRTTRLLDFESMRRRYVLRVRASDWGLPYRRQAEMRLVVRLEDVNDNRPQFERVDCSGHLPRHLPLGTELVTLSAIDFDAGNIVTYRIVSGNDDNCFGLDSASGVVSVACDLAAVRADVRVLNVTATDGTHFADTASLTLRLGGGGAGAGAGAAAALECRDTGVARRLTELLAAAERGNAPPDAADDFPPTPSRYGLNVHAPEFLDFPVEVKVNESVSLGTSLVRLRAHDRDLGYNGLLVYGISGGDVDSAFRVDPDTGELKVIGYLDREREAEYYLNVTVYDLGEPRKSASRLLPITVLDVNDNSPVFEKSLASYRVTENALNGTAIFRANATDRDAGAFGRVTYSLEDAAGAGDFGVDADGVVRVRAALDRERRALYELRLLATDGGGRRAEAAVRVFVDDVNDNPPRFSLPAYAARVREDLPAGSPVAVVQAFDPDLGAAGRVRYALAAHDLEDAGAAFAVDELSGVVRTLRALDYEERQVYGVTVVARDGGRPALSAEVSLIAEVTDVDENAHAPAFAERVLAGRVRENRAAGARVLSAAAADADAPGRDSRLAYYVLAGSGMGYFSIDDTGEIRTLMPLDRETTPHYWLTVCAQDHGLIPKHSCVQVYIEVEDENDTVPWTERAQYEASVPEHCAAGTRVAAVRAADDDLNTTLTYRIVAGNPDGLFAIDERTGDVATTGRVLDREATDTLSLEVRVSDGALASSARVLVRVADVNDHAPAFLDASLSLRVPVPAAPPAPPAQSDAAEAAPAAEAEAGAGAASDEDEADNELDDADGDGDARRGDKLSWEAGGDDARDADVYVATVLALDGDAGENGTVRYWVRGRGAARGLFRLHPRSGRLYARRALPPDAYYQLAVRACDGGRPARCSAARVALRTVRAAGDACGGVPAAAVPAPLALSVAELEPPGFLLAVLHRHSAPLYYDIVAGDPRGEFYMGRENGNLVLARRPLWERRALYSLDVSVTDGCDTRHTTVNVSVINDVNEGGVRFSRDHYEVHVEESARVGEALAALRGEPGEAAGGGLLYGLHAARRADGLRLFRVGETSGVLELAAPLDREAAAAHELTVWVRDRAPRAARAYARVSVRVHDADDHAPDWGRRLATAHLPADAPAGALVAKLRATDRDTGENGRVTYSLAGGNAGGVFAVHPALGDVTLAAALPAAAAGGEYTLLVRAANPPPGAGATLPLHVVLVEPDAAPPRLAARELVAEVAEDAPRGWPVARLEARSGSGVWFELLGDDAAAFALNPAAGVLTTARRLDFETRPLHNLTVRATNMGGGYAEAAVYVHVLDRNEFPPRLEKSQYFGTVSEAAPPSTLVTERAAPAAAPAPLVLRTLDADSPANRQRAYRVLDPDAAAHFAVDPVTGALTLVARVDYERKSLYKFRVKVEDAGTPRLTADSAAEVTVRVTDVNDCPPEFSRASYEATLLRPTAVGVAVASVAARDPDAAAGSPLKYDIIEGDDAGAFAVDETGRLLVRRPEGLADSYRLRVRASDGVYSSTARVRVRVRDAEESGLAFQKSDYYGSVVENTTKPTTVAVLNVLGTALGEHVEFRILNPGAPFEIGATSGAVRTTGAPFDREAADAYTLLVQARGGEPEAEGGGRVARARLHVAVSDVNDNCPTFVELPYAGAVEAGAPPGTRVLTVRALDADAGDNGDVRYEMKRGHGELFRVDRRTGLVSLKQTVDARDRLYRLVIAAFDGGVPACGAEAEVSVRVWGGGAAPRWERAHYALAVREDAAVGAPLAPPGALLAVSPLARQLIYTVHRQDPERPALFHLHFETAPDGGNNPCVLVARAALDYEARREHALVLRATDGATGAHADADLTLRVLDVNDCAPEFARDEYRAAVSEAAPPGHLVLRVRAADNDTGVNGEMVFSLAGEEASLFSVRGAAGEEAWAELVLARPLDRETRAAHHLLLTATDRGTPALATTVHVFVTVEDANDCAPRVEREVVAGAVSAEARRGLLVARVAAADADAGARLRYALQAAAPAGAARAFAVHAASGAVRVDNPRALAALAPGAPLSLNVSVSDGAHAAFARVKLAVTAANRHAPRFSHVLYEARALENQPPPLLITTVRAHDEDEPAGGGGGGGGGGGPRYWIPSAALRETFAVDAATGALRAVVPLDRERRAEWRVPVAAADAGGLPAHTAVRVRVADLNDNAPLFLHREYRATVSPARAPHHPFLTVYAEDADEGANAKITYSIYEGEEGERGAGAGAQARGLFTVDAATGAVSLARNASGLESLVVQVWVRARDGGGLAAEAPLSVLLTSAPLAPPLPPQPPQPPDYFLPETAPPGTTIAQVRLAGAPADAEGVRFRLAGGAWPRDLFAVEPGGAVVLAGRLDRERAALHHLAVLAERGAAASTFLLRLHVLDDNDHAPVFHSQPYVLSLAENAPPHTSVLQLMADDEDSGSNGEVRFSLAEESAGAPFALDAHTGWLTTLAALDREAAPEWRLQVVASDGGAAPRATRGTVVVRLKDYNDEPPLFAAENYSASVAEDALPGTVIVKLEFTDEDFEETPVEYYILSGDPQCQFQVRSTGEVFVAKPLDREAVATYDLEVAVTDGKFTDTAALHVHVLDVNDNPPYCVRHRYYAALREDAAAGTDVLTVEARDADEPQNARLRHYLSGEGAELFAVDAESGRVTVAAPLDREATPLLRLVAHVRDRDRADWSCESHLHVRLEDVNDNAPRFSMPQYAVTLPEDAEPGTPVAKLLAADPDLGANGLVRYALDADAPADEELAAPFRVDEDSGIVTLRAPLDRETRAAYRVRVRAVDGGEPALSATALLLLTVADVNDNPPEFGFKRYHASVPEIDAVGTEIARVSATSGDAGLNAEVRYSIVGGNDRDTFAVDRETGAISIARPLDYERTKEYLLTVQAIDCGSPPLSNVATVNVTVLDGNDNAPAFTRASYVARVREDAALGERVAQVIADDADDGPNGRVAYSVEAGDRDGRFAVDPDTGYVSVAAPLDREARALYVLEMRARDRGLPALEASATLTVEVVDANDNPPLFAETNYTAVVHEDRPLGHTLLKFVVTDADAPPNAAPYTFDFQSGNEMGAFRLEQDGYLRSATEFNHRVKDRYVLQVRVFDNGTPPLYSDAWVYVKVIEESQYPPVVTPLEVVVNSYLDEYPGGVVGRVYATDRDAYDQLTFKIEPVAGSLYPATDLFEIDARDGTLRALPRLDVGEYAINVTVDDGKFVGHALVRVTVELITDEMLAEAIVVRFREVTARDFVLSHRKGFVRAVRGAMDCRASDVVIVSVQPSGAEAEAGAGRARRQVARDLDVLFAVRREAGGFHSGEALRRMLHARLEALEESARLVVEEMVRGACGGCERGVCRERAVLLPGAEAVAADVCSLVVAPHRLEAACACLAGWTGERCDLPAGPAAPRVAPSDVASFAGDGYLQYRVDKGVVNGERLLEDELLLSLRFRTLHSHGTLAYAGGRVDYNALEVEDGFVQFRMELGSGSARARAGARVADGAWHEVRLERRGGSARLTVDRHVAHARAPPPARVLDLRADYLYLGARLVRHAHALAKEQVTFGFVGCVTDVRLGGAALQLAEEATAAGAARARLEKRVRVRAAAACPPPPTPTACASYPCLNGGTCVAGALLEEEWSCTCHARFAGRRCEADTDPCASQPCLHGGYCEPAPPAAARAFACSCPRGLSGARCEAGRWCGAGEAAGGAVCAHGGECEEGEWGPSCRCHGYYGPLCQYDVDECAGEPCLNGATCVNEPGSFRCLCPPDKTGMNCGNPLTDAVLSGAAPAEAARSPWARVGRWLRDAGWPAWAGAAAALALLLLLATLLALRCARSPVAREPAHPPPHKDNLLNSRARDVKRGSKLSNLEAVRGARDRERPASCAHDPHHHHPHHPLNNIDTLRSYGSAGEELEGIPVDYIRNLNLDTDHKPWSEQMHLHTFTDNKIYNDLKGDRAPSSPPPLDARDNRLRGGGAGAGAGAVYHWDCSDWCAAGERALPDITEVAGSERPDSSTPPSRSPALSLSLSLERVPSRSRPHARAPRRRPERARDAAGGGDEDDRADASSCADDEDPYDFNASSYLLHPDAYLPRAAPEAAAGGEAAPRAASPAAASLITMLEERRSLLADSRTSLSDRSDRLCEIEDSDCEHAPDRRRGADADEPDPEPDLDLDPNLRLELESAAARRGVRQTDV